MSFSVCMGNQHHTAGGGNRFINILFTTSNTKNLAIGATPTPTAFVVDELLTLHDADATRVY